MLIWEVSVLTGRPEHEAVANQRDTENNQLSEGIQTWATCDQPS